MDVYIYQAYDVLALTTKQLFRELAPDYSPSNDPWGCAIGAFFAVCDSLTFEHGLDCPAAWMFSPSPFGQLCGGYEYEILQEIKPSEAELYRLGCFLHRLTDRLDRAGFSY